MNVPGWQGRGEVLAPVIARADEAAVFLDVDGVLAPIMPLPDQTYVPDEIRDAVRRLLGVFELVAVVSGRAASDAGRLVDLREILVVGNHGMESLLEGQRTWLVSDEAIARVRSALEGLENDEVLMEAGVRLEDKTASVALHTRGAENADRAWELAVSAARRAANENELVMLPGRRVIDLRPPGINKGTAVRALVDQHRLRASMYIGDDRTDVDAFRVLRTFREEHGLATANVAVVSDESPDELFEWADLAVDFETVGDLLGYLADEPRPAAE